MRENLPELITIHLCVNAKIPDQMVPDRFTPLSKYIIIICCILIVVAAVLFVIGFNEQVQQRKHEIQVHLVNTAETIAGQVNGDGLLALRPGDEDSPAYLVFAQTIFDGRKNDPDLSGTYILRDDNGTFSYVIDDAYLTHGLDSTVARIGDVETADLPTLSAARSGPVYSQEIYDSRWGSYLSGYALVKDSNGTVVGILGVDETADMVFLYQYTDLFQLVEVL